MNPLPRWRRNLITGYLSNEGVIAYPTEGVWGLGCLPEAGSAVGRLLRLKRRDWDQGLLLVAADISQFEVYLEGLATTLLDKLDQHWPGPVTFLVPDNGAAPAWIVGKHQTLGLRVSSHPTVRELCEDNGPLVSTSANVTGHPAAMTPIQLRRYFGDRLDHIVPGSLGGAKGPSTIRHLVSGEVIR